jgi:hypothetical protein
MRSKLILHDHSLVIRYSVKRAIRTPALPIEFKRDAGLISHPLQQILQRVIDHPQCGAFVLWAVHGSGKTTILRQAAGNLIRSDRNALFLDAAEFKHQRHVHPLLWLHAALGNLEPDLSYASFLPPPTHGIYSPPPTCIIIDQFDHMIHHEHAESFVVGLAEKSRLTKRFSVIVSVTNPENARTVLRWNGGEKVKLVGGPHVGCWEADRIRALIQQLHLPDDQRDKLLELGTIAKTPAYVLDAAFSGVPINDAFHETRARELQERWRVGISMLDELACVSVNYDPKSPFL